MNDVINLLKAHRSIRRFTDKPLSDVEVAEIMAAAQAASTSSFVQAYSIIRITDPEKRGVLATMAGKQLMWQVPRSFGCFVQTGNAIFNVSVVKLSNLLISPGRNLP